MNILVLFGGKSVEHDVSIITAYQIMSKMNQNIYPVYITKNQDMYYVKDYEIDDFKNFKSGKKVSFVKGGIKIYNTKTIDMALILMHGTNGEDGLMAAVLDFYNIPYVNSNHLSSSVSQDKFFMKCIFRDNQIPIVDFDVLNDFEYAYGYDFKYPCIVKPTLLGSSIGVAICNNQEQLDDSLSKAFKYGKTVIIERKIEKFREINCAFIGDYEYQEASKIEEVVNENEFLDFDNKYKHKLECEKIFPAIIDINIENRIKELGYKIMKIMNLSGIIRIDFMIEGDTVYVNEVNSIPGALAYYLFDDNFDIENRLLKIGYKNKYNKEKKIYAYDSTILDEKGMKK